MKKLFNLLCIIINTKNNLKMKKLFTFFYILLVIFTGIGGVGSLFYHNAPQFAIGLSVLTILVVLNFFNLIKLPTKDDIS